MAQPACTLATNNFGYRLGAFGFYGDMPAWISAKCYLLFRLQEALVAESNLNVFAMRPLVSHQYFCEETTPDTTVAVTTSVDGGVIPQDLYADNAGDTYYYQTFTANSPREPYGSAIGGAGFDQYNNPRVYCVGVNSFCSDADVDDDDKAYLRGGTIEHKHDVNFTQAKYYTCYRGSTTSSRIHAPYHFFSAYHARNLIRDTYNSLLQSARMHISLPYYSDTDIEFRTIEV